jgi:arylsulfatase A-like enzyme
MVEAVDLLPTFVEYAGGIINHARIEGKSLMPLLRSSITPGDWRQFALSEIDYSDRAACSLLNLAPYDCRALMIRDKRWKYVHHNLFRAQLFDMQKDPQELNDLGDDPAYAKLRADMQQLVIESRRRLKPRVGVPYENLAGMGPAQSEAQGIAIGRW